jgi:hypothetical protein
VGGHGGGGGLWVDDAVSGVLAGCLFFSFLFSGFASFFWMVERGRCLDLDGV